MRPSLSIKTTDSQHRWSARRIALLRQLDAMPRTVNRSWCPKITPGVRPGTEGGDLRRLVREGFAELEHKPGPPQQTQLLPSGERSTRRRRINEAKRVVLTEKGKELLSLHSSSPSRESDPWAKRRQGLVEAGLVKPVPSARSKKGLSR